MSKYNRYVVINSDGEFAQSYSTLLSNSESFAKWCGFVTEGTVFGEYINENNEIKHKQIWDYKEAQDKKYNRTR